MYQYNDRTLKSWYDELDGDRAAYLDRAESASKLTLPWYVQRNGDKNGTLKTPYQSVGAEGVTNLASRLVMVIMPPNRPLFRLRIARKIVEASNNPQKAKLLTEINTGLSRIEKEVTGIIETTGDRTNLFAAMLHLLISGNVLLHVMPEGMKVFPLRSYVVQRDPDGNVITIIVKEEVAYEALPKKIRKALVSNALHAEDEETRSTLHPYEIYTLIKLVGDKWVVRQECEDMAIGKAGMYPLDLCPWLPLRLYRSEEEAYGRGYVEQYIGSLHSLECLSEALVQASVAASKVVFLVHPNATTKIDQLTKAENLAFVVGNKADIDVLQIEKYNDLQVAKAQIQELTASLSKVFLMHTSIQRNAERVTAEEIRYMAQELETALGGLYSVLAKEFQKPYITLRIHYLQEDGLIDTFADGLVPETVTGVDALGRGQDATALVQYGDNVFKTLPPQASMQYINIQGYLKALAAAYGIDDTTILKSDEILEQERAQAQQAQQEQALNNISPDLIKAGAGLMGKSIDKGEILE